MNSKKMNKETIKNSVSLFLHCQKLIAKPKRLHYSELKSVLGQVITEVEYNAIIKSIFNLADHYFFLEKYQHPTKLLIEINRLADLIRLNISPNQKIVFITFILRLIKINKQEKNKHLENALFCIAEIFSFNIRQTSSIKKLFFNTGPNEDEYKDSVFLTNEQPDCTKVIDGLKVIYNKDFSFKIWVKNVKSVNNMLFKVVEYDDKKLELGLDVGDILTYNSAIQHLLNLHSVSLNSISSKIISNISIPPRIEIESTERSPKVTLSNIENRIEIEGVSMINHPLNFYKPVFYWLEKLKETSPPFLSLHINLSFFNTYTSKIILKIFQKALDFESKECKVKFYWHYEEDDEELKEAGEQYSSIISRQFTFICSSDTSLISA